MLNIYKAKHKEEVAPIKHDSGADSETAKLRRRKEVVVRSTSLQKRLLASLSMAALVFAPAAATAQGSPNPPSCETKIAQRLPELMQRYDVAGLGLALIERGEVTWMSSWGTANGSRPLEQDALFRVESISKPVTAWGVMRLVERGAVDLDAPVAGYLKGWSFPPSGRSTTSITVRELLTHTAGLPLGDFSARFDPRAPVPDLRSHLTVEARPIGAAGTHFMYSDTGFNLLELLIEEVSGERFADFMRREVLSPLGMTSARFEWTPGLAKKIPEGHDLNGAAVPFYVYPAHASGGLLATVSDVARFAQAGLSPAFRSDHQVLENSSIALLHAPQVPTGGPLRFVSPAYGLGHFVEPLSDGRRSVWHGGQGYGWMSHFQVIPDSGDGIVLLSNSQRAWPLFAYVLRVWSECNRVAPVGMTRIRYVIGAVWAIILSASALCAALLLGLVLGRRERHRVLTRLTPTSRLGRFVLAGLSLALASLLLWARAQPYLFLASVAPHAMRPLWIALVFLAVVLALAAVLPRRDAVLPS